MLFKVRFHEGILSGAITLTFRSWDAPRVKVGSRYRFGLRHATNDYLVVDSVYDVEVGSISEADALRSGFKNRAELCETLAQTATATSRIFRIAFHYAEDQVDARVALRQDLSPKNLQAVADWLSRMDRLSPNGPWTRQVLTLIQQQPRVAASRLAPQLNRDVPSFKTDVRKLKGLGLTISHEVGYELSPRGLALLTVKA